MLVTTLLLLLTGASAGLLLGLLGIGCGLVIVPVLAFWLPRHGVAPEVTMQVAIATSLGIILLTSIASLIMHQRNHNIMWPLLKKMGGGSVIGAILGSLLAHRLDTQILSLLFGVFVLIMAIKMLWANKRASQQPHQEPRPLPNRWILIAMATGIAFISCLIGIGGGTFTIPFLRRYQIPMPKAVATSVCCGMLISVGGTLGLSLWGQQVSQLPLSSSGYLIWPIFIPLAVGSLIFAPIGAKLAHHLHTELLQRFFAVCLLVAGVKMLLGVY